MFEICFRTVRRNFTCYTCFQDYFYFQSLGEGVDVDIGGLVVGGGGVL